MWPAREPRQRAWRKTTSGFRLIEGAWPHFPVREWLFPRSPWPGNTDHPPARCWGLIAGMVLPLLGPSEGVVGKAIITVYSNAAQNGPKRSTSRVVLCQPVGDSSDKNCQTLV